MFFSQIWLYSLLTDIGEHTPSKMLKLPGIRALLAIFYVVLNMMGRAPDPLWALGFLSIVPVMPGAYAIAQLGRQAEPQPKGYSHSLWNIGSYVFGGGALILVIIGTALFFMMPPTGVVSGNEMRKGDLEFLRTEGMLSQNEEPIYFCSWGIFSIEEEGQFLTETEVVTYQDFNRELGVYRAAYEDIAHIAVDESPLDFAGTIVTVSDIWGSEFRLFLSSEGTRDTEFVAELKYRWAIANRRGASELVQTGFLMKSDQASSLFHHLSSRFEAGFPIEKIHELQSSMNRLKRNEQDQCNLYVSHKGESSPLAIVLVIDDIGQLSVLFYGSQAVVDFIDLEFEHFDGSGT